MLTLTLLTQSRMFTKPNKVVLVPKLCKVVFVPKPNKHDHLTTLITV